MDEFERNREIALVQSSHETNQGKSAGPEAKDGGSGLARYADGDRAGPSRTGKAAVAHREEER